MKLARQYLDSLENQDDFDLADVMSDDADTTDALAATDATTEEGADYLTRGDELEDVSVELEETQEALEAMREDKNAPEYAQLALLSRVHCLYNRLDLELQLASNESHVGNRFDDAVFVDSLESSLKETAQRVSAAITNSISKAVQSFAKAWTFLTTTRDKINRRSQALQKKIGAMSDEDFKAVEGNAGAILKKVNKSAIAAAVTKGNSLVFGKDHAKQCQGLMGETQKMIDREKKATEKFASELTKLSENYSEQKAEGKHESAIESISAAYLISTVRGGKEPTRAEVDKIVKGSKLPIGDTPMAPGGVGPVATNRGASFEPWSKFEMRVNEASFKDWVGSKQSVLDTAKFVSSASSADGIASKDTQKAIEKWYKEMKKIAGKAGASMGAKEISGLRIAASVVLGALFLPAGIFNAAVPPLAYRGVMRMMVGVGFSTSMSAMKAWVKSLSSMNVVLAAVAK